MNRVQKEQSAESLRKSLSKAKLAVFADYKGLQSAKADLLRRNLRGFNTEVKVLKNNIGRLVTKDGSFGAEAKELMESVVGPTIIAFAFDDPTTVAKVVHKFAQDNEEFNLKDSLMGDKRIGSSSIEELANLPSKEFLIAKMLGSVQAPTTNLVRMLSAVHSSLVRVLAAIEKKKAESQSQSSEIEK